MKKILILLVMLLLTDTAFAEDIYIGDLQNYSAYLRTESICPYLKYEAGNPIANLNIYFKTILIPHQDELLKLRKLLLDDTIDYKVTNFHIAIAYNRISDMPGTESLSFIKKTSYCLSNSSKSAFKDKQENVIIPLSDQTPILLSLYDTVTKYTKDHPEIVRYYEKP